MSIICQEEKIKQYAGYLFVYFIGDEENEEQIYFSLSGDGLHWNDLIGGHPILFSQIGEEGVRDPLSFDHLKKIDFLLLQRI